MDEEKKHPGQPAKYNSAEELKQRADEYFNQAIAKGWKITITGLALWLGFASRQSIYDYEKQGEYSYAIKNARMKVENAYESRLYDSNAGGAIFALKNLGWRDDKNLNIGGQEDNPLNITVTVHNEAVKAPESPQEAENG